ncbi:MAG: hypothetical protein AAFV78_20785, partial [Bacteroidota bacterium]
MVKWKGGQMEHGIFGDWKDMNIGFTHQLDIHILPISEDAMLHLASLPLHHKDPFDRLILSEGICHQI